MGLPLPVSGTRRGGGTGRWINSARVRLGHKGELLFEVLNLRSLEFIQRYGAVLGGVETPQKDLSGILLLSFRRLRGERHRYDEQYGSEEFHDHS